MSWMWRDYSPRNCLFLKEMTLRKEASYPVVASISSESLGALSSSSASASSSFVVLLAVASSSEPGMKNRKLSLTASLARCSFVGFANKSCILILIQSLKPRGHNSLFFPLRRESSTSCDIGRCARRVLFLLRNASQMSGRVHLGRWSSVLSYYRSSFWALEN